MRATITKIHPQKYSRNGNSYIRIDFQMEDGTWAKTDLCPNYRNFARWKPIIGFGVGTALGNLILKRKGEVNADSFPSIIRVPLPKKEVPQLPEQNSLFQTA